MSLRPLLFALIVAAALWLDPAWLMAVPMLLMPPLFAPSCTIFSDDFSTDRTGTDYTTGSGSWSVSGGALSCTSATAVLVSNTALSGSATGVVVTASVTCTTTSDIARIIIDYTDSNNYVFAEIQPGASNGTLKLFQRSGGTNTQLQTTQTVTGFVANSAISVCMSYQPDTVSISTGIVGSIQAMSAELTIALASTKCGLGTGSGTSSVTFDNFTITTHKIDTATCSTCMVCNACSGTLPAELQVDISGMADAGSCAGCNQWDATFVVGVSNCNCLNGGGPFIGDCPQNLNHCRWVTTGTFASRVCAAGASSADYCLNVTIIKSGGTYTLGVNAYDGNGQDFSSSKSYLSAPDCGTFSAESLSPLTTANCDPTSSTVTVTSL